MVQAPKEPTAVEVFFGRSRYHRHRRQASPSSHRRLWCLGGGACICYYRDEGCAVHDGRVVFEFLTLEAAQTGTPWPAILCKRDHCGRAAHGCLRYDGVAAAATTAARGFR